MCLKSKQTNFRNVHSLVKIVFPFSSVLHAPLLLSDSRLHLFLQSDLGITKMEKCALGKTRYTVAEAIQRSGNSCIDGLEDKASCESDCERYLTKQNGLCRRPFSCYTSDPCFSFLQQQFFIRLGTKCGQFIARKPHPILGDLWQRPGAVQSSFRITHCILTLSICT